MTPEDEKPDDEQKSESEDEKILRESREGLEACITDESGQRDLMLDDLKFATLDQWPSDLRNARENDVVNGPRPCLTIDQINQYITQVSNDMSANRPSIKTRPVDDVADPETAEIFQGLIRHIEDQSSAHIAYQTSGESAVTIGLGFFRIVSEYVSPDSFDQELLIKRIPDTFSVYLSSHVMPDGSDAEKAWVMERMPLEKFKREYPKAKVKDEDFTGLGTTPVWKAEKTVTVCEYFYKDYTQAELVFTADGRSMSGEDYDKLSEPRPEVTGRRETQKATVQWCKHTGCEILEKRTLKGKYIPIVEEVGKEKIVEGKRVLWGLVRPAKDSLRAFNYWVSALTEKMALAPKAPWVGVVGQFATQGDRWDKSNTTNYSRLEYDPVDINGQPAPAPHRTEPIQMEPAIANLLAIMQNNVKSSLGMYKASIGDTESQQSGRAILALQKESNTGTSHFGENQAISVTHGGRILVDIIPYYYDTKRVIRILGEDGKPQTAQIDPGLQDGQGKPLPKREIQDASGKIRKIYNLGVGKYDVTVTVGPGYTTSRQEAATVMRELAATAKDPASAAIFGYGAIKSSDFHGSEELTRMLKAMLPPQVLPPEDGQQPLPPAAMQKMQQMDQQIQMMNEAGQKLMQENQQLKSSEAQAQAKIAAQAKQVADEFELKRQQAKEEADFQVWKARLDAATKVAVAEIGAKQSTDQALLEAEHAANLEFMKSVGEPGQGGAATEPKAGLRDVMMGLMQAMGQMAQNQSGMMQMNQRAMDMQQMMVDHQNRPRTVSLSEVKKNPRGEVVGVTINPQLQ